MKSKLYKQYRFIDGKFITMNNCSYGFHIDETDSFYDQMREPLKKGKFDGLTYIHIDKITIEDKQDIFFEEKSFTLNAILLDVDDKGEATSVLILIKKVRLICDEYSKKIARTMKYLCHVAA